MKKEIKKLSKNEQKAIVGGSGTVCLPVYCAALKKKVCPDLC